MVHAFQWDCSCQNVIYPQVVLAILLPRTKGRGAFDGPGSLDQAGRSVCAVQGPGRQERCWEQGTQVGLLPGAVGTTLSQEVGFSGHQPSHHGLCSGKRTPETSRLRHRQEGRGEAWDSRDIPSPVLEMSWEKGHSLSDGLSPCQWLLVAADGMCVCVCAHACVRVYTCRKTKHQSV